ncbi:probable inactive receptor kinase At3g08680, partial [Olea europaea var. sylvestris]|uniref:probable inactive receptor kinase At3g08680 n=1 Tax=Olea europaea var. sylvestris TaxID=158386 RepID=UPI000C1D5E23
MSVRPWSTRIRAQLTRETLRLGMKHWLVELNSLLRPSRATPSHLHATLHCLGMAPTPLTTKAPLLVPWYRPPCDILKFNIDGARCGNPGRAGYGGATLVLFSARHISGIVVNIGFHQTSVVPIKIFEIIQKRRLHVNTLSDSLPDPALPDAICKDLHFIYLGQNTFSGNFPEFITRFHGFKELDLGNNMFSGPIPESITGLKLEKLNLSHNNFSG